MEGQIINSNSELAWMLGFESPDELIGHITDMASQMFYSEEKSEEFFFRLLEQEQLSQFKSRILRKMVPIFGDYAMPKL